MDWFVSGLHWSPALSDGHKCPDWKSSAQTAVRVVAMGLALLLLPALAAEPVHAQTYVDADATGNDDGSAWTDASPTLQGALQNASNGDEIWIAEGTYYPDEGGGTTDGDPAASFGITPSTSAGNLKIYGGFSEGELNRSARAPGSNPVVLSGDISQDDATTAGGITPDTTAINGTVDIGAYEDAIAAAPMTITNTTPPNGGQIPQTGSPAVTFNRTVRSGQPFADRIQVRGRQTGRIGATAITGGGTQTLTYDPSSDFAPGERVRVAYRASLESDGGPTLDTTQTVTYTAEAAPGPATFPLPKAVSTDEDGDRDLVVGAD